MKKRVFAPASVIAFGLLSIVPPPGPRPEKTAPAAPAWKLNAQEYFEKPALSVLVFHNIYPEGKQGGIEIIQNGERIASVGDVRLEATPGQWGGKPAAGKRVVDRSAGRVEVPMRFVKEGLDYRVSVEPCGESICLTVDLARPLPKELEGRAGFNIELFPPAFFARSFHLGRTAGIFPRQGNGPVAAGTSGGVRPTPLAEGPRLVASAEDPSHRLTIESMGGNLKLYDGRDTETHGWFVVRSLIPVGACAGAVRWRITPNAVPGWRRPLMIAHSQVGYHPGQEKIAIIERDPDAPEPGEVVLLRIDPDKGLQPVLCKPLTPWGRFLRYDYATFDFTQIKEPGVYILTCGDGRTAPFRIGDDVYRKGVWQPTLETFFPAQMCHVRVVDRGRVWHGLCHMDDALQPAPNLDLSLVEDYRQGPTTDTPFAAGAHIPGLDRGGWHDAGDFDLAGASQADATLMLALARECFGIDTDQTTVNQRRREVLLHEPDGKPDILQEIAHGAEGLLGPYRAAGHSFIGISDPSLEQYMCQGDAGSMTDNRFFDARLGPDEVRGDRSGRRDDRLAFTSRDTGIEYHVAAALAAAGRTLAGFNDTLARECLHTAVKTWEYERTHPPVHQPGPGVPDKPEEREVMAVVELLFSTREARFADRLKELLSVIEVNAGTVGWTVTRAFAAVKDAEFTRRVGAALALYGKELGGSLRRNPFGIPFEPQIWGVTWDIQDYAVRQYFLHHAYPGVFPRENLLRVLNYVLGCHPASPTSLVSGVGSESLLVAYGTNVNEWSYIPGGGVSGPSLIRPDFPELKEPFPFLWQQSEYVIGGAATFLFTVLAADQLLEDGTTSRKIL